MSFALTALHRVHPSRSVEGHAVPPDVGVTVLRWFVLATMLFVVSPAFADECASSPPLYEAEYSLVRKGKAAGFMQVILKQKSTDNFVYSMDTHAKWGIVSPRILQQSVFTLKDGVVLPVSFQAIQKVSFYKRRESLDFNWEKQTAIGRKKRVDFAMDIHSGVQDKLTIYLLLARELCKGEYTIDADVASGPVIKTYQYRFQAKETLPTALGTLDTIHIRRGDAGDEKQTDIWHAEAIGFLPVKLVYRNKDAVTTMSLTEISFGRGPD